MSSTVTENINPMLTVRDIDETIAFYASVLGFTTPMHTPDYAMIERNGRLIHLQAAAFEQAIRALAGHVEIYIEVSDIQPLWQHLSTFKIGTAFATCSTASTV